MLETYELEELRPLVGHEVIDANGESVGYIDLIFRDDETGRPEWLGVWNGVWDTKPRVLVPIRGIEVIDDEIRLPWTKDVVQNAPSYDEEDDRGLFDDDADAIGISAEKELLAYDHYGVEPLTKPSTPAIGARFRVWRIEERARHL
jgi:hypothetical protein